MQEYSVIFWNKLRCLPGCPPVAISALKRPEFILCVMRLETGKGKRRIVWRGNYIGNLTLTENGIVSVNVCRFTKQHFTDFSRYSNPKRVSKTDVYKTSMRNYQ